MAIKEKLSYLLEQMAMTRGEFVSRFHNETHSDKRTIQSWLEDSNSPTKDKVEKLSKFFGGMIGAVDGRLKCFEEAASFDDFKFQVDLVISKYDLYLKLNGPLSNISEKTGLFICGTYFTYRLSSLFKGVVIREVLILSRRSISAKFLDAHMYCLRAHVPQDLSDRDEFSGIFFRYGNCFNAILSLHNVVAGEGSLMHFLQFPLLNATRPVHYGLISGFSVSKGEPVAGRIIARRTSETPASRYDASSGVRRMRSDDEEVAPFIALLHNSLGPDGQVLDVNRANPVLAEIAHQT